MTPRERAVLTIAAEAGPAWPMTPREFQSQLRQPRWLDDASIGVVRSVLARLARQGLLARHVVGSKMIDYTITFTGRDAIEQEART